MRHTLPFEICTILPFYLNWINDIFENISDKYKEISIFKKLNVFSFDCFLYQYNDYTYL